MDIKPIKTKTDYQAALKEIETLMDAPPELFKQLKPGGRMLIPIGQPFKRGQFLYVYTKDADGKVHSKKDVGVFFIPMTGTMMKTPAPKPIEG